MTSKQRKHSFAHLYSYSRQFLDKEVTKEEIQSLMAAAMQAPSAMNEQPCHFIVITKKETKEKLMTVHPYASALKTAPLAILVVLDKSKDLANGYLPQDGAAATENILLAAESLSLHGVWCGVYPVEERVQAISKLFGLSEQFIPFALICIGHAEPHTPVSRLSEKCIHWEEW